MAKRITEHEMIINMTQKQRVKCKNSNFTFRQIWRGSATFLLMKFICLIFFVLSFLSSSLNACEFNADDHCASNEKREKVVSKFEYQSHQEQSDNHDDPHFPDCEGQCHIHCHLLVSLKDPSVGIDIKLQLISHDYPFLEQKKTNRFILRINRPPIS